MDYFIEESIPAIASEVERRHERRTVVPRARFNSFVKALPIPTRRLADSLNRETVIFGVSRRRAMFTVVTTAVGSRCVVGVNDLRTRDCIAAATFQRLVRHGLSTLSQRSIHAPVVFDFAGLQKRFERNGSSFFF